MEDKKGHLTTCLIVITTIWSLALFTLFTIQGISINRLENEVAKISTNNYELSKQIEEAERSYERMLDTCLDVIKNKRWE